jgi:SWI/SNF-related matrix-associated actin-dependent regulator 1 of chromatin subfamily A
MLKWVPTIKPEHIQIFKTGKDPFKEESYIYILSYELASKRAEEIAKKGFNVCIADEAHYLKSRDAKRSKLLIPIL